MVFPQAGALVSAAREGCVSPLSLGEGGRGRGAGVPQAGTVSFPDKALHRQVYLIPIRKGVPRGRTQPGTFPKHKLPGRPRGQGPLPLRPGAASWRGRSCPVRQERPHPRPHSPQIESHQVLSPSAPTCHLPGIPEFWLARGSPTNGKGRGMNTGLPLAGTKAASLPCGDECLSLGRLTALLPKRAAVPLD